MLLTDGLRRLRAPMYKDTKQAIKALREIAQLEGWPQQRLRSMTGIIKSLPPAEAMSAVRRIKEEHCND